MKDEKVNTKSAVEPLISGTEKEVQARVEFKLNELLTALENRAKTEWNVAFKEGSQKHSNYWEAFNELKLMLRKEIELATPINDMAENNRRIKRDEAVNIISERLVKRGEPNYQNKVRLIVSAIEDAQYW